MAAGNIEDRRIAVKELLTQPNYTPRDIKLIADTFGCSDGAVRSDIIELKRTDSTTLYPSAKTKRKVFERDNHTCQYCGDKESWLIAEHVIPLSLGGVGVSYNLVASCQSCNMKKKNKVKLPNNHLILKAENPGWYNKILSMLPKGSEPTLAQLWAEMNKQKTT